MSGNLEEIKAILRVNNPFASSAAGDPRTTKYPNVEGIDKNVYDNLVHLIGQVSTGDGEGRAASVLGEAGSGKTHLIGRLIAASQTDNSKYSFAYIRPLTDPNSAFRYVLREIIINLTGKKKSKSEYCQLEILGAHIFSKAVTEIAPTMNNQNIKKYARICQKNPLLPLEFHKQPAKVKVNWVSKIAKMMAEEHVEMNPNFIKVFLQYFAFRKKRLAATNWLMGRSIDEADLELLDVETRSGIPPETLEQEAQEIIQSLAVIITHYSSRPLIVFFDQLENLKERRQIDKFENILYFLSDATPSILPMAFFRGQDWDEKYKVTFNDSTLGRLNANQFRLTGCTREQAKELITARLDWALADIQRPNELYPLMPDYESDVSSHILRYPYITPRQVLYHSNNILMKYFGQRPVDRTEMEVMSEEYKTRVQEVLANFDQYRADEGRLTLALKLYLENRSPKNPYQVSNIELCGEQIHYIDLKADITPADASGAHPLAAMVDVELHHASVGASLKRGTDHLSNQKLGKAIYVRDERCPFPPRPNWPATNNKMESLQDLGGATLILNAEDVARWYALTLLSYDVEAGEVTMDDGRALDHSTLKVFIQKEIRGDKIDAFKPLDEYLKSSRRTPKKKLKTETETAPKRPSTPLPTPGKVADAALRFLKSAPAKMMKADVLAEKISTKFKAATETDSLVLLLGEYNDRFNILRARDGVIVRLNIGWLNDQSKR